MVPSILTSRDESYEIGDRVIFKAQFNNPGHYKPDDMLHGEVICRYKNGTHFTYRIRLDMRWGDRVAARGKPIIMGNLQAGRISPESEK